MLKKYIINLIKYIDRLIHVNFQFLNSGGKGKFNKNYEWIYKYLDKEETGLTHNTFIEVGSRDCLDSLDIISRYDFAKGYVFEPSYAGIKESIKNQEENIDLSRKLLFFPFALGEQNVEITYYEYIEISKDHTKPNIGASTRYGDKSSKSFQEYEVPMFKLDSLDFNFKSNYLIIMDAEGSEYFVLKGALKTLRKNKYVCLEAQYGPQEGNCLDTKELLESINYKLVDCDWPNTQKGYLPEIEKVKNSKFCLLFENELYK